MDNPERRIRGGVRQLRGSGRDLNGHVPQVPYSRQDPEGDGVSIRDLLVILVKGKWLILGSWVLVTAVAAWWVLRQPPVYQASSVIYVNNQQISPQLDDYLGNGLAYRNIANEVEILKSRSTAERLAAELLARHGDTRADVLPVLHRANGTLLTTEDLANRLQYRISARPVRPEVDLIRLTATSTVPEEAQIVANVYAETYRSHNRKASRAQTTASREFLNQIADQFSVQLQAAEDELTAFLHRERLVEPDAEARQILEQVAQLQSLQYQTQLEIGMAEAEIRGLEAEMNRIRPGLAAKLTSSDDLVMDRLKVQLANLQVEEQQIFARTPSRRDQPRSGRLAQIEQELTQLTQQLDERVERVISRNAASQPDNISSIGEASGAAGILQSLGTLRDAMMKKSIEISGLHARLEIVEGQLETYKSRLETIPTKALVLQRLQRSQQAQEQLYVALLEKMQEARIAEQSELGYVEIVDTARLPRMPVGPAVPRTVGMGALLGLMMGIGLALLRNAVDNRVREPDDLEATGLPLFGVLPDLRKLIKQEFGGLDRKALDGHSYSTRLVSLLSPLSAAAEAYRGLRTNIQFMSPEVSPQTIVVTSPEPSAGKTITSLNLAVLMSQTGARTLYLDADLRKPSGHSVYGVERMPGLTDLLLDAAPPDFRQFRRADHLYILPAGRPVRNSSELLGSHVFTQFLAHARDEFDVVIIDTPPTLSVVDASLLVALCDATVIVCSAGSTRKQSLDRTIDALYQVGATNLTVALNRFEPSKAYGKYAYGYSYGHRYGYGDINGHGSS